MSPEMFNDYIRKKLTDLIKKAGMETVLYELDNIVVSEIDKRVESYLEQLSANLQKTLSDYQRRND